MADFQKVVHRVGPSRVFRILSRHTVVVRSDTSARRGLQMQRKREKVETEQTAGGWPGRSGTAAYGWLCGLVSLSWTLCG